MANEPSYSQTIEISGITGDTPVCTKMNILSRYDDTYDVTRVNELTVSNNNPNKSYTIDIFNSSTRLDITLYDSEGNEIAKKVGIRMTK